MIGVGQSHYASPDFGPFKCSNCEYFKGPTFCGNKTVMRDAKDGLLPLLEGKAVIKPNGCCNEYSPK